MKRGSMVWRYCRQCETLFVVILSDVRGVYQHRGIAEFDAEHAERRGEPWTEGVTMAPRSLLQLESGINAEDTR
jgi:hypothetical protein